MPQQSSLFHKVRQSLSAEKELMDQKVNMTTVIAVVTILVSVYGWLAHLQSTTFTEADGEIVKQVIRANEKEVAELKIVVAKLPPVEWRDMALEQNNRLMRIETLLERLSALHEDNGHTK